MAKMAFRCAFTLCHYKIVVVSLLALNCFLGAYDSGWQ